MVEQKQHKKGNFIQWYTAIQKNNTFKKIDRTKSFWSGFQNFSKHEASLVKLVFTETIILNSYVIYRRW